VLRHATLSANHLQREINMTIKAAYTVSATAAGGRRDGKVTLSDGALNLVMEAPKDLGGSGKGHNPEQLFAAGYAACYIGAMRYATTQDKSLAAVPADATVTATVGIGARADKGFGLVVKLEVSLPGVSAAEAQRLVDAGHGICPYSHATKGNIEVTTTIA
jgi:lipoyl-dependent peroxiredoxin